MIKNVVLTGMMGVGKTTIGKNLAEKLSFSFLDTDKIIEEEEGSSIKDIFKKRSEILSSTKLSFSSTEFTKSVYALVICFFN